MQQEISLEDRHRALLTQKRIMVNRFDVLQGILADTTNAIADISASLAILEQELFPPEQTKPEKEEKTDNGGTPESPS